MDHIEKKKITPHHANVYVIGGKTMGSLTIGFNRENYIHIQIDFLS